MAKRKVYQVLASRVGTYLNCVAKPENNGWETKHRDFIEDIVKQTAPSGSGFDCGTILDFDKSTDEKLVFTTEFHHMSEHGFYTCWTKHNVVVTPSLAFGFDIKVTGRDVRGIKDFIGDCFAVWLNEETSEE